MIGAGNPPYCFWFGATPNRTRRRHRVVPLAPRPLSRRATSSHQIKTATVVLVVLCEYYQKLLFPRNLTARQDGGRARCGESENGDYGKFSRLMPHNRPPGGWRISAIGQCQIISLAEM